MKIKLGKDIIKLNEEEDWLEPTPSLTYQEATKIGQRDSEQYMQEVKQRLSECGYTNIELAPLFPHRSSAEWYENYSTIIKFDYRDCTFRACCGGEGMYLYFVDEDGKEIEIYTMKDLFDILGIYDDESWVDFNNNVARGDVKYDNIYDNNICYLYWYITGPNGETVYSYDMGWDDCYSIDDLIDQLTDVRYIDDSVNECFEAGTFYYPEDEDEENKVEESIDIDDLESTESSLTKGEVRHGATSSFYELTKDQVDLLLKLTQSPEYIKDIEHKLSQDDYWGEVFKDNKRIWAEIFSNYYGYVGMVNNINDDILSKLDVHDVPMVNDSDDYLTHLVVNNMSDEDIKDLFNHLFNRFQAEESLKESHDENNFLEITSSAPRYTQTYNCNGIWSCRLSKESKKVLYNILIIYMPQYDWKSYLEENNSWVLVGFNPTSTSGSPYIQLKIVYPRDEFNNEKNIQSIDVPSQYIEKFLEAIGDSSIDMYKVYNEQLLKEEDEENFLEVDDVEYDEFYNRFNLSNKVKEKIISEYSKYNIIPEKSTSSGRIIDKPYKGLIWLGKSDFNCSWYITKSSWSKELTVFSRTSPRSASGIITIQEPDLKQFCQDFGIPSMILESLDNNLEVTNTFEVDENNANILRDYLEGSCASYKIGRFVFELWDVGLESLGGIDGVYECSGGNITKYEVLSTLPHEKEKEWIEKIKTNDDSVIFDILDFIDTNDIVYRGEFTDIKDCIDGISKSYGWDDSYDNFIKRYSKKQ